MFNRIDYTHVIHLRCLRPISISVLVWCAPLITQYVNWKWEPHFWCWRFCVLRRSSTSFDTCFVLDQIKIESFGRCKKDNLKVKKKHFYFFNTPNGQRQRERGNSQVNHLLVRIYVSRAITVQPTIQKKTASISVVPFYSIVHVANRALLPFR